MTAHPLAIIIFEQKTLKRCKSNLHLSNIDGANDNFKKKGWSLKLFLHGTKTISDTKVNERNISVP